MHTLTTLQALELVDHAANENRLYHHNGGQAYIRVSMDSNALMIIDHTMVDRPEVTLHDGTEYFKSYSTYNIEHSRRLRDHGSLAQWYFDNYLKVAV
jgi:hypothetical protein